MKPHRLNSDVPFSAFWSNSYGTLICLIALFLPFFPDEKLVRLKLEVFEILIFSSVLILGVRSSLTLRWPILDQNRRRVWWSVFFWVLVMASLFLLGEEKALAQAEWRRVILALGCFLVFFFGSVEKDWLKRFLIVWSLGAGLLALYGCLQVSGGIGPISVPKAHRALATFGNPIFFAAYLLVSLFLSLSALTLSKKTIWGTLITASLFFQLVALYLTKTRAAWIAFAFSLGIYFLLRGGLKKVPAIAGAFVLLGALVFGILTQDTWKRDQGHLMIWRDTLQMWQDHKVFGIGLGSFHAEFPDYAKEDLKAKWPKGKFIVNYAHNEYVQMLAESGVVGFGSFLLILFLFFKVVWGRFRLKEKPTFHRLADWIVVSVVALLIQNFFSVDMRFSISFGLLFLLMGLALFAYSEETSLAPLQFGAIRLSQSAGFLVGAGWVAFMIFWIGPGLMKPYVAHKKFSSKVGFFDSRLLDPAKTISDLEKLKKDHPNEPAILEKLAFAYAKEIKSREKRINSAMADRAVATYQELLEIDPTNHSANNNLANIFYTVGQTEKALSQWEKAVENNPNLLDVHLNLGKIYYTRGELKKSAKHFEKVLQKDPSNVDAQIYLKRMVE